jgi:hypothetical protein
LITSAGDDLVKAASPSRWPERVKDRTGEVPGHKQQGSKLDRFGGCGGGSPRNNGALHFQLKNPDRFPLHGPIGVGEPLKFYGDFRP